MTTKTRPLARLSGPEVIEHIESSDLALRKLGLEEAKFRSSKAVQAAVKAAKGTRSKAAAEVAPAKPKGPGSRGGDPVKARCAELASKHFAKGTSEWWGAYRKATAAARKAGKLA